MEPAGARSAIHRLSRWATPALRLAWCGGARRGGAARGDVPVLRSGSAAAAASTFIAAPASVGAGRGGVARGFRRQASGCGHRCSLRLGGGQRPHFAVAAERWLRRGGAGRGEVLAPREMQGRWGRRRHDRPVLNLLRYSLLPKYAQDTACYACGGPCSAAWFWNNVPVDRLTL